MSECAEDFAELYDINDTSILHRDRFLFIFDGLDDWPTHLHYLCNKVHIH